MNPQLKREFGFLASFWQILNLDNIKTNIYIESEAVMDFSVVNSVFGLSP